MIKLYPPLYELKEMGPGLWIVDGEIIKMHFGLGIKVPFSTRMTIVKLVNGDLWVHSPIHLPEKLKVAVEELGPVKHLISSNKIHYAYIPEWQEAFPEAISWSSPGVEERAGNQGQPVEFDRALTDQAPPAWQGEIDQFIFKGSHVIEEVVFYHHASKTLILTDLIENFETEYTQSKVLKAVQHIGQIAYPKGRTPIDYRLSFLGNHGKAKASAQKLLVWQPERIIISHGKIIEDQATEYLEKAFHWALK